MLLYIVLPMYDFCSPSIIPVSLIIGLANEIIAKATELGIYTPRESRVSEFKQNREKILALLAEQKTSKEISEILKIDEAKIQAWAGQLEAEQTEPKSVSKSKAKAA